MIGVNLTAGTLYPDRKKFLIGNHVEPPLVHPEDAQAKQEPELVR